MILLWTQEVSEVKAAVVGTNYIPFDPMYGIKDENGNLMTKEAIEKQGGVFVESIPQPKPNGKMPIHFVNPQIGEQWYEYEEIPKTEMEILKEELAAVKAENKELKLAIAESVEAQQQDKVENQLAVAELAEIVATNFIMAKLYWDLIKMNLLTVDQVPLLWRDAVQALLDNENK
ncbi:CD1375 family protein [Lysinibacillus sphaericus]|uniref:CD1375 family protein n=1 Tax=Lysinibacillus sphaericus TaxID=1421 RepID=UPI00211DF625|nr:CD1375 family protein [Lysinibacillus sphaericus]